MKNLLSGTLTFLLVLPVYLAVGQVPPGYYDPATGLFGLPLQQALHNIIKNHEVESYGDLWDDYYDTDRKSNGKVWDIYSDVPGGNPPYEYTFFSDQCGNYNSEGDCYNREHSFPQSWFGDGAYPMYSDLYQVYPTDGYVNGKRSNYPYGTVNNPTWTSMNGCKLGNCTYPGYSQTVFEPINAYKGDLARTYFYMAVRYYSEDGSWPGSPMVNGSQPKPWALAMLRAWHHADPVSEKEINRNNAIYQIQQNRNPFIDHPEYVEYIWGNVSVTETIDIRDYISMVNPVKERIEIALSAEIVNEHWNYSVVSISGRCMLSGSFSDVSSFSLDISDFEQGPYLFIMINPDSGVRFHSKIIKL